jgi:hypothetical protein
MFTGIVEEVGEILAVDAGADVVRLTVRGPTVTSDARHGDSIAISGVCLTVTDTDGTAFTVELVPDLRLRAGRDPLRQYPVQAHVAELPGHVERDHRRPRDARLVGSQNEQPVRYAVGRDDQHVGGQGVGHSGDRAGQPVHPVGVVLLGWPDPDGRLGPDAWRRGEGHRERRRGRPGGQLGQQRASGRGAGLARVEHREQRDRGQHRAAQVGNGRDRPAGLLGDDRHLAE